MFSKAILAHVIPIPISYIMSNISLGYNVIYSFLLKIINILCLTNLNFLGLMRFCCGQSYPAHQMLAHVRIAT